VCLFLRFKDARYFENRRRRNLAFVPGSLCLKLFRHIPQSDLETLFPNAEVRMRMVDRLFLGVPALVGVAHFLFFKLGWGMLVVMFLAILFLLRVRQDEPNLKELITAGVTLGVFAAYLIRQWFRFKNRKIFFLKVLSENLYFRNLDNGPGVFYHLIHEAEDAEVNEALLAYVFLASAAQPLRQEELQQRVEQWISPRARSPVHFETSDALAKLERLGLLTSRDGCCTPVSLGEAQRLLEEQWSEVLQGRSRGSLDPGGRRERTGQPRAHEDAAERPLPG